MRTISASTSIRMRAGWPGGPRPSIDPSFGPGPSIPAMDPSHGSQPSIPAIGHQAKLSPGRGSRAARRENSPSGLWRTLGKRVGVTPSGVRIPHSPPSDPPCDCIWLLLARLGWCVKSHKTVLHHRAVVRGNGSCLCEPCLAAKSGWCLERRSCSMALVGPRLRGAVRFALLPRGSVGHLARSARDTCAHDARLHCGLVALPGHLCRGDRRSTRVPRILEIHAGSARHIRQLGDDRSHLPAELAPTHSATSSPSAPIR